MMNNIELKDKLIDLVNNHATVYAYGCWGNQLTESLIETKARQYPWWYTESKKKELKAMTKLGYVVWGFDCSCMIKSILWGWNADTSKTTGGAIYNNNDDVPDINANEMIRRCNHISENFSSIDVGEVVWLDGHIGVYIGDGQVVECTPAWQNKVQITKLSQRKWLKHGKLPWIIYEEANPFLGTKGYLQEGDHGENIEKICNFMAEKVKGNYFGPYLKSTIMEFQKQKGIESDGNIGPITLSKLKEDGFKE